MRPSIDDYFMSMAKLVATRSTCARRQVGAILVNKRNHVLATGYNGVAAGLMHCTEFPCGGARMASGTGLDACEAIHGEQNALLQCHDVYQIETLYCTASPCVTCTKLLMNTSCQRIVYEEEYPHSQSRNYWLSTPGRAWTRWQSGSQTTAMTTGG